MPQCTPQEMCPEENPSVPCSFCHRRRRLFIRLLAAEFQFDCPHLQLPCNSAEEQLQILLFSRSSSSSSSSNKLRRHTDRRPSLICVAVSGWLVVDAVPPSIVPCGMWIECTITLAAIPIPGYPKSQSPLLLLLLVLHQPSIYLPPPVPHLIIS